MKWLDKHTLKLDKEINQLDQFVIDFIRILKRHTDYVVISGYVSILFGRSRATEDIDMFIEKIDKITFSALYQDLKQNNYWCLNAESTDEIYSYLQEGLAVRFAKENTTIPNFEVKFPKKRLDFESFDDRLTIIIKDKEIKISSIERQIAFKRYYLKSDKDLEDANYIESLFKDKLDLNRIRQYKKELEDEILKAR